MNELIEVDASNLAELTIRRPPATVIEEARHAALALKDVLDKKPNKVMMGGEQFLEIEDWETVAQFYGCKPKVVSTNPVKFGDIMGFEATAIAFHVASGKEVSRAESMCLNDEEKWSSRNKYEWAYCKKSGGHSVEDPGPGEIILVDNPRNPGRRAPKKEKVLTGQEHVPLFQLRSMAQTRACAKALRLAFSWVVVLAGYKPTPAEELPDAVVVPQHELKPGEIRIHEDGTATQRTMKGTVLEPTTAEALKEMGVTPRDEAVANIVGAILDPPVAKTFNQILMEIDANADWNTLKQDWKNERKLKNLSTLTPSAQKQFLEAMREKIGPAFPY